MKNVVPGLANGISILKALQRYGSLKHDEIFKITKIPKSTVSRQLESLKQLGLVVRKGYYFSAQYHLEKVTVGNVGFLGRVRFVLDRLAEETHCCAEWYEIADDDIKLVERSEPKGKVYVRVIIRAGGCFYMEGRLNALKRIALLSGVAAAVNPRWWDKVDEDTIIELSADDVEKSLREVEKSDLLTYDPVYNTYGVKRCAIAVNYPGDMGLHGILSLAVSRKGGVDDWDLDFLKKKMKWARRILENCPENCLD